jgi:hypothetical protein
MRFFKTCVQVRHRRATVDFIISFVTVQSSGLCKLLPYIRSQSGRMRNVPRAQSLASRYSILKVIRRLWDSVGLQPWIVIHGVTRKKWRWW